MKKFFFKIVSVLCIIVFLNCTDKKAMSETNMISKIKDDAVINFSTYSLIVKFTNFIYEEDGKKIKIPIFQGNSGDVSYDDFLEYCYTKKYLKPKSAETSLVIKADKGRLTKTFHEFLMFYKGNILKDTDINMPAKILVDGGVLELYYDFKVNEVPFVLQISISTGQEDVNTSLIKSIFDVNLNENMKTPIFHFRFWKNYTSDEL
ncbi:MAG TPA: hypothetical protein P5070_12760 [Bacteroidia bacterium]|nr:hypothetical protein [Bacteroidia bacterium]